MPRENGERYIRSSVDPDFVKKKKTEYADLGESSLKANKESIEKTLDEVFKVAKSESGDFDIEAKGVSEIDGFKGTVSERCTRIVEMHSELAAIEDLLHLRHQAGMARQEILDYREADQELRGQPASQVLTQQHATNQIMAGFRETLNGMNTDFKNVHDRLKAGAKMFFSVDMSLDQYFAAVVKTSAGWDPFVRRQPGHVPAISRPLQLIDVIPMRATNQHSIKYMMQTTRTVSAVVEKAEGAASGEVSLAWTERTEDMREIPAHVPVTEIQLEDEPQIRAIIEQDLGLAVMQRLDGQLINGNGTAPNIAGILHTRNGDAVVSTDWTEASNVRSDQISDLKKAKTKISFGDGGYVMPNVCIINPSIWDEIALSETTAAGYYLGSPANDFQERIWGLPVVLTDHLAAGNTDGDNGAIICDTTWMTHWVRRGLHIEVGYNSDDFTKRQLTFRAGVRCCVQVRRPKAVNKLVMTT